VSLDASLGARAWLFPDFVRLRMLPIRERIFGFCCGAAVDGEEGVPLAFVCGELVSGKRSGTECGMFAATAAMLGVLTGLVRMEAC
jgi:hypothetical protein